MNYTIKDDKTYLKRVYHTRGGIVYKIDSNNINDNTFSDDEVVNYDKLPDDKIFITLTYTDDSGNVMKKFINLQDYIICGTKMDELVSLSEKFKAQQEKEMYDRISNGADPTEVYESLPDFFQGKTEVCVNGKVMALAVIPPVKIEKPEGANLNDNIQKEAKEIAEKAVDNYLSGMNSNVAYNFTINFSRSKS